MLEEDEDIMLAPATDKQKWREREEFEMDPTNRSSEYPPIREDVEETRRVEENLRRWEVAERQRRKAARESQSQSVPSLVSDVSRRASLLFSGRKAKQNSIGNLANMSALQSQDSIDNVPLTSDMSLHPHSPSRLEHPTDRDPIANSSTSVPKSPVSPFDDVYAVQNSTPKPPQKTLTYDATGQQRQRPPSPRPLNLPPPRSPPPIFPVDEDERDTQIEIRWWHDWLCGCGEGPDRGGDHQAARTNPLE